MSERRTILNHIAIIASFSAQETATNVAVNQGNNNAGSTQQAAGNLPMLDVQFNLINCQFRRTMAIENIYLAMTNEGRQTAPLRLLTTGSC
jgi:hypothetical protein